MFEFGEKVVMITGATGGLGQTVTRAFQSGGARLALVDRKRDGLLQTFPDLADKAEHLLAPCADITDVDQVNATVAEVANRCGRIDILVNIAGGYRAGTPVHETTLDTWEFMVNLNARSVFLTGRAVMPHMLRQGYGKIISVAARAALTGGANMGAYSVSKSAVVRLTESMSAEVKSGGINVNCILPGTIDTAANRAASPDADFSQWVTPEAMANVILFLASDRAAAIHGAAIPVYGLS